MSEDEDEDEKHQDAEKGMQTNCEIIQMIQEQIPKIIKNNNKDTVEALLQVPLRSPSPCLSVNWKAWIKRRVSSTERPTGRSLMVICLKMPLSSITNRPLRDKPGVYNKAPGITGKHKRLNDIELLSK